MQLQDANDLLGKTSKETCEPIGLACKTYRSGNNVPIGSTIWLQLMLRLLDCSSYAKLASRVLTGEAKLICSTSILRGRRTKHVAIVSAKQSIPVTKARLYASKSAKSVCKKCGKNKRQCLRARNLAKLRAEIESQLIEHRQDVRSELLQLASQPARSTTVLLRVKALTHCPYSGARLQGGQTHVDHVVPFSQLIKDWASESPTSRDFCRKRLSKSQLANWSCYHKQHAKLVLCSQKANLRKGSKRIAMP